MVTKRHVSHVHLRRMANNLLEQIKRANFNPSRIIGIERGGVPLAQLLAGALEKPLNTIYISAYDGETKRPVPKIDLRGLTYSIGESVLIVDDLVDTGSTIETFKTYLDQQCIVSKSAVFYYKPHSVVKPDFFVEQTDDWIIFPWE